MKKLLSIIMCISLLLTLASCDDQKSTFKIKSVKPGENGVRHIMFVELDVLYSIGDTIPYGGNPKLYVIEKKMKR
jgi:hypothetical protein